jgi:hypothetical protein
MCCIDTEIVTLSSHSSTRNSFTAQKFLRKLGIPNTSNRIMYTILIKLFSFSYPGFWAKPTSLEISNEKVCFTS